MDKKSIALVGSFNLADGYLGAAKALRALGHQVDFIPAHLYRNEEKDHVNKIIEEIRKFESDVVLWWRGETLTPNAMALIRSEVDGMFIMFSWDDPHQWEGGHFVSGKMQYMDIAFSCCQGSLQTYLDNGCKKAIYCLPGFDPDIHKPEKDDEYKCDISIVCTNLYDGHQITRHKHLSRKVLIDSLIRLFPEADIRIYGSESFKDLYGSRYRGWVPFNESNKVFYNSKINIDTHIRPDGYLYLNERVGQILGSGGLLMIDPVNGVEEIFKVGEECMVLDCNSDDDLKNQITDILERDDHYDTVRENGRRKGLEMMTWAVWANTILNNVS